MDWSSLIPWAIAVLAPVVGSIVYKALADVSITKKYHLDGVVRDIVARGVSYAEQWAANQKKGQPEAKTSSASKLSFATEFIRSELARQKVSLPAESIRARIEETVLFQVKK